MYTHAHSDSSCHMRHMESGEPGWSGQSLRICAVHITALIGKQAVPSHCLRAYVHIHAGGMDALLAASFMEVQLTLGAKEGSSGFSASS